MVPKQSSPPARHAPAPPPHAPTTSAPSSPKNRHPAPAPSAAGFHPPALRLQRFTKLCRTTTLPHNRIMNRCTGSAIPHHRRFPLIRDSDRRNVRGRHTTIRKHPARRRQLRIPNLIRVMPHPPGLWIHLLKFLLRHRHNIAALSKEYCANSSFPGPTPKYTCSCPHPLVQNNRNLPLTLKFSVSTDLSIPSSTSVKDHACSLEVRRCW